MVSDALRLVKELITAVDNKVNQQEKKQRLKEVYRYKVVSVMEFTYSWISCSDDLHDVGHQSSSFHQTVPSLPSSEHSTNAPKPTSEVYVAQFQLMSVE